ncbi:hypothetical protein M8J77_018906 [Diaphorina citri]|nr:hypothetical protein M8J77_018906 [Diaphorina citri]
MTDIKCLEHPTLKVPYEILNKKFRAVQKTIDREVSYVQSAANELEKTIASSEKPPLTEVTRLLGGMFERLQALKRKAGESIGEELQAGHVIKRRIEHLKEHSGNVLSSTSQSEASINQWKKTRLDRMLIEYFLRKGYYSTAQKLAQASNITDLTNIDVFLVSHQIAESLQQHETSKCLTWCHENKSKLRKLRSGLEFNVRMQEFIELVRADKRVDAVHHARKHFSAPEEDQLEDIRKCMVLLAFPKNIELSPYKELFDYSRWDRLIEQFHMEKQRLFQLAPQCVFTVALQAGLSALKTPQCYSEVMETRNKSCPVCTEPFNTLAKSLPYAHCTQSRLVCSISGLQLNEYNQPIVLPNGYVYGEQALSKMAAENDGKVQCPKTKEIFKYRRAQKVYVM